ncbi:hypothetical protein ACFFQF_29250 [Haladaptatus pallidirubidus]|uniref:hypothetical protein n=1 Tax=Haladaptatus pallidirubidus TaxID=1008152 RepID=UPI0035EB5076
MGLNILDSGVGSADPMFDTAVENLVEDLTKMIGIDEYWGPRMDGITKTMVRATARLDYEFTLLDLADIIEERKILVVRMGPERDELKQMVSMAIIRRLWSHVRARAEMREIDCIPCNLFIDEFDYVAHQDSALPTMLSKARSLGLGFGDSSDDTTTTTTGPQPQTESPATTTAPVTTSTTRTTTATQTTSTATQATTVPTRWIHPRPPSRIEMRRFRLR